MRERRNVRAIRLIINVLVHSSSQRTCRDAPSFFKNKLCCPTGVVLFVVVVVVVVLARLQSDLATVPGFWPCDDDDDDVGGGPMREARTLLYSDSKKLRLTNRPDSDDVFVGGQAGRQAGKQNQQEATSKKAWTKRSM